MAEQIQKCHFIKRILHLMRLLEEKHLELDEISAGN